jgi:hypothetical protein
MFNRPVAGRVKGNGMGGGHKKGVNRKMKRVKNRGGGR